MPTLFRFLVIIGVIVGIVYGAMFALVTFVEPKKGEMTVRVPLEKLDQLADETAPPASKLSSK